MDIVLKEINSCTREMKIQISWEEIEPLFLKTIIKFGKSISIPGFRRGKVPRRVIMQNFRAEVEADFIEQALEEFFLLALKDKRITPVNRANISELEFHEGSSLRFKATFEVEPDVVLPKYRKKLKVKKNIYIPDEEDIDQYIEDIRQHFAELKTIESGSKEGHLLLVDMQEMDSTGVPIIGKRIEDRYIKVGDGIFGGENLDNLTGLKAGDEALIYIQKQNGQERVGYKISVKNVHEEILPEVDYKFIKEVDKNASNETEFRENVMNRIQSRLDRDANVHMQENIIDYFLQNTKLEVPPSLIDNYIENIIEDHKNKNGEKIDEEKLRKELKPSTVRNIKWYLIRKAIINVEELSVTDEEVSEKVSEILEKAGKETKEAQRFYKKPSNREKLRDDILDKKLFSFLESVAKVDEVKVHTRDLRKHQGIN